MPLKSFDELFAGADALKSPVPVAVAGRADATVIQALDLARRRGWVTPILTGERDRIQQIAEHLDLELNTFKIVDAPADSAIEAVRLVKSGEAKLLMKGQISTPSLMKAVLDREHGLRTGKTICQVVLMEILRDKKSFLMTDTGVTVAPNLQQKKELIETAIDVAHRLGCKTPRVALMAATEKPTPAMPDTVETQQLVEHYEGQPCGDAIVQGPLSFDLAYAAEAGTRKRVQGEVTGAADVMVFPDLLSANLTVKGIMYTSDCRFGGVLRGTTQPVVFMSRADTTDVRMNSLAYALHIYNTNS